MTYVSHIICVTYHRRRVSFLRIYVVYVSYEVYDTEWRKLTGCLIFMGHFLQKSPILSDSFAGKDLQLKTSYGSSPPCMWHRWVVIHSYGYFTRHFRMKLTWHMCDISYVSHIIYVMRVSYLCHTLYTKYMMSYTSCEFLLCVRCVTQVGRILRCETHMTYMICDSFIWGMMCHTYLWNSHDAYVYFVDDVWHR